MCPRLDAAAHVSQRCQPLVCHLARAAPSLRRQAHEYPAAATQLAAALAARLATLRHAAGRGLGLGRRWRERGGERGGGGGERRGRQAEQYVVGARRVRRM